MRLPLALLSFLLLLASCGGLEEQELTLLDAYKGRALQYYEAKRYDQCRQQATLGLRISPDDAILNHTMGRALLELRGLKRIVDARPFLEKAHELEPTYRTSHSLAEFHHRYGVFLHDEYLRIQLSLKTFPEDDQEKRKELLDRAEHAQEIAVEHWGICLDYLATSFQEAPDYLRGMRLAASTHSLLGQDATAISYLTRILEVLSESQLYKNRQLATNTAMTIAQEQRLRQDLLKDMEDEIAVRFVLSSIWKRAKDLKAEEHEYDLILSLSPQRPEALFGRGICRYEQGRIQDAVSDLQRFIRNSDLSQDSPYVRQALQILTEHQALSGPQQ